jgi:hypothetical protein
MGLASDFDGLRKFAVAILRGDDSLGVVDIKKRHGSSLAGFCSWTVLSFHV